MNGLSASGLADLADVTEVEVARLVELGILVVRDGTDPVPRDRCAEGPPGGGVRAGRATGVPLDTLGAVLESMGFARMGPDEPMREDELEVVPLLQLGLSSGTFDLAWLTRLGRAHADGLRLLATSWTEAYQARFEGPALESWCGAVGLGGTVTSR